MAPDATAPHARFATGSVTLDNALDGGLPRGAMILVEGEEGAGAVEFAMTMLRQFTLDKSVGALRFLSALRSAPRVAREIDELFHGEDGLKRIEVVHVESARADGRDVLPMLDAPPGSLLVLESAAALARIDPHRGLLPLVRLVADKAAEAQLLVLLISTPDTLSADVEASVAEAADGVLSFRWLESGNARRRLLRIKKMRGLVPALDGDQIPVFEVGLHRGRGFSISRVKSLI